MRGKIRGEMPLNPRSAGRDHGRNGYKGCIDDPMRSHVNPNLESLYKGLQEELDYKI